MANDNHIDNPLDPAAVVRGLEQLWGPAVFVGPAGANKDPVTPEQLQEYQKAFMEEVRKGDLLFHGDGALARKDWRQPLQLGNGLRDVSSHGR